MSPGRPRVLHVYCGPFPTAQGTQVLIHQTCSLSQKAGHEPHLICYSSGRKSDTAEFPVHRIADFPRFTSERSGLAWQKPLLDLSAVHKVRTMVRRLRPDVIHAHHTEAMLACALANITGSTPILFHLHARLEPELPLYSPAPLAPLARMAGRALDVYAPRLAQMVITLDEATRDHLVSSGIPDKAVRTVSLPAMAPPDADTTETRGRKKDTLRLIYTGNLDPYQGLENALGAMAVLNNANEKRVRLNIVTGSNPDLLLRTISQMGVQDLVTVTDHGSPGQAWRQMKEADAMIVPRRLSGGVPVKILNAFAGAIPVIMDRSLAATLRVDKAVITTPMKDPGAIATCLSGLVKDRGALKRFSKLSAKNAGGYFSPESYMDRLSRCYQLCTSCQVEDRLHWGTAER